MISRKFENYLYGILGLVGLIAIILLCVINFTCMRTGLNSEIAFEMIFSKQIEIEKSIFPLNFYYGYELSPLRPALMAALINVILGNMIISYAIALTIVLFLVVAFFVILLREMGFSIKGILIGAISYLFLSSYKENIYTVFLLNGYYGFYIITILISLISILRIHKEKKHTKMIYLSNSFSFLIAFIYGVSGVRMLVALYIPMLSGVITAFIRKRIVEGQHKFAKNLLLKENMVFIIGVSFFSVIGFLIFNIFLKNKFILGAAPSEFQFVPIAQVWNRIIESIGACLQTLHINGDCKILSVPGIAYMIKIFLSGSCCLYLFKRRTDEKVDIVLLVLGWSVAISLFFLSFSSWKIMSRYFFMFPLFFAILLAEISEKLHLTDSIVNGAFLSIITVGVITNIMIQYDDFIPQINSKPQNEDEIISYISSNNVKNGYGDLCGLEIGPLSNFNVTLGYILPDHLNEKYIKVDNMSSGLCYSPELADQPSFILTTTANYQNPERENINKIFSSAKSHQEIGKYFVSIFDFSPFVDISISPKTGQKFVHYPSNPLYEIKNFTPEGKKIIKKDVKIQSEIKSPDIKVKKGRYNLECVYSIDKISQDSKVTLRIKKGSELIEEQILNCNENSISVEFNSSSTYNISYELIDETKNNVVIDKFIFSKIE